jgi:hypothetical protein
LDEAGLSDDVGFGASGLGADSVDGFVSPLLDVLDADPSLLESVEDFPAVLL